MKLILIPILFLFGCSNEPTYTVAEFTSPSEFVVDKITKIEGNKNMYECTYSNISDRYYNHARIIGPIGFSIGDTLILTKKITHDYISNK
jgi:hypothetical protein